MIQEERRSNKSASADYLTLAYALVTPARNEAAYIEYTIRSVIGQTVPPVRWVIVSDGSTDGTENIVARYARSNHWILLLRMPERKERHFGGKAAAFNAGYAMLRDVGFDIIGNLDADISFDEQYFAYLLSKFAQDSRLGVAGTPFREGETHYDYRFSRKEHVSGACQLFRRECFASIGGYVPRKEGGIDLVAVVTARMKGWKTETFTDKVCIHHRPQGKAGPHFIKYSFKSGYGDYVIGVLPAWQLFRSFYQMSKKPYFIAGFLLLTGYLWAMLFGPRDVVSKEFINFRRHEQMGWLKEYYRKALSFLK